MRRRHDEAMALMNEGFVRVVPERPGLLFHRLGDDVTPAEVSLPAWFNVRGICEASTPVRPD